MASRHTVAYWIVTGLAAALMALSGVADLLASEQVLEVARRLGYPDYLATILGVAKLMGAVALVAPRLPQWVREWAYAGMVFDLVGAAVSHVAVGDPIGETLKPLGFLVPVLASWVLWKTRRAAPRA